MPDDGLDIFVGIRMALAFVKRANGVSAGDRDKLLEL